MKKAFLFILILVFLVSTLAAFMPSFSIPLAHTNPVASWTGLYSQDIDYGNSTHVATVYMGPQVFWNNNTNSWQTLLLENHIENSSNPYYLVRNALITAKIGYSSQLDTIGVLYYDTNFTQQRAAEFWNVQAYLSGSWVTLNKTYYNNTVVQDSQSINVTALSRVFYNAVQVGWIQITYVLRQGSPLKHLVIFKSIYSQTETLRAVMTLYGIAGDKVTDRLGSQTVTLNETQIVSNFLRFVNSSNPNVQLLEENLNSLGHYDANNTWVNDWIQYIRLKLEAYQGLNLIRCDIVIGNYTVAQNDIFTIDPTTSTFYGLTGSNDGYAYTMDESTYALAHDATTGDGSNDAAGTMTFGQKKVASPVSYAVYRAFLKFDTSALGANTITAAVLGLKGYATHTTGANFTINLQKWTDDTPIDTGDFAKFDGTTYDDGGFNTSSFSTSVYNNITISNFGLINKAGNTLICVRSSNDTANQSTTGDAYVEVYTYDNGGNHPQLIVIWTNTAPTNDALTLDLTGASYKGTKTLLAEKQDYKFVHQCSDPDGVTDITYAEIRLDYASKNVILRATRGSGDAWTFSEQSDPSDYVTLDTGSCASSTSGTQKTFNYYVKIGWGWASASETLGVRTYVVDSQSQSDTDDYINIFGVCADLTAYSLSVNDYRCNPSQSLTFTGYWYYTGTSIPPSDGSGYAVVIKLSGVQKGSTYDSLISGYFSIAANAESSVASYSYTVECDPAKMATAGSFTAVVMDKVEVFQKDDPLASTLGTLVSASGFCIYDEQGFIPYVDVLITNNRDHKVTVAWVDVAFENVTYQDSSFEGMIDIAGRMDMNRNLASGEHCTTETKLKMPFSKEVSTIGLEVRVEIEGKEVLESFLIETPQRAQTTQAPPQSTPEPQTQRSQTKPSVDYPLRPLVPVTLFCGVMAAMVLVLRPKRRKHMKDNKNQRKTYHLMAADPLKNP